MSAAVPLRQDVSRRAEAAATALATHVSKGLEQRAIEGKHTGGIPFGYQSCWADGEKGDKRLACDPEHPGGVHVDAKEGRMVTEMFHRYSSGMTTLLKSRGALAVGFV